MQFSVPIFNTTSGLIFEQVCVYGQGRKQPIAVIVLSQLVTDSADLMEYKLEKNLTRVNTQLERHQRLDHLIVLKEEWTIENGLLTPTMKIKRAEIETKFNHYLEQDLADKIIWQ